MESEMKTIEEMLDALAVDPDLRQVDHPNWLNHWSNNSASPVHPAVTA